MKPQDDFEKKQRRTAIVNLFELREPIRPNCGYNIDVGAFVNLAEQGGIGNAVRFFRIASQFAFAF
jgi:hypothetical protein